MIIDYETRQALNKIGTGLGKVGDALTSVSQNYSRHILLEELHALEQGQFVSTEESRARREEIRFILFGEKSSRP